MGPVRLSTAISINYNTKKPQRNAEALTTTAMVSLLQSEGR